MPYSSQSSAGFTLIEFQVMNFGKRAEVKRHSWTPSSAVGLTYKIWAAPATGLKLYNPTPVKVAPADGFTSPAESGLPWVAMWTRPEGGFSTPASPATLASTPLVPAYSPVVPLVPQMLQHHVEDCGQTLKANGSDMRRMEVHSHKSTHPLYNT